MQTGNTDFIYKNELDKACFDKFSDKFWKDKAFNIASDPKYDCYQTGLASMVYNFFDKKSSGSGFINDPNYQLANQLHKQIIRKLKKKSLFFF